MAAEVGQSAPDFTLPSQTGEPVTLSQFRGRKHAILSFHILDFTGG